MLHSLACAASVLVMTLFGVTSAAAELKVLSTPTLRAALQDALPTFEQETGHRVTVAYDPVGAIKRRIDGGETFDLAILVPNIAEELVKSGSVDGATRTTVARAGYGVAVRADAKSPDVSTVPALKQALLEARFLAYSPDSNSSAYFVSLIEKLGLSEQLKPKLKPVSGPHVVETVGSGEADLTIITIPNIVGERGVRLAGALPPEVQNYSVFVAACSTRGANRSDALSLLRYLGSDFFTAALKTRGLERAP